MPDDDADWTWNVAWWSDPVLLGRYPEEGLVRYEKFLPKMTEEDMRLINDVLTEIKNRGYDMSDAEKEQLKLTI